MDVHVGCIGMHAQACSSLPEMTISRTAANEDVFMMRSSYVIYESIDIAKKAGEDEKGDRRKTGEEAETACGWEGANNREG